ncbi:MAG: aspartate/glutamate racemase family protein [Candidatus Aenigmarchaeota archaeon]|nr:aspartate/glutamate racemase family protein [Candidatus Aenigmarchaeota archaeon]
MTIGVIGGMSPETTSAFYLRLIELSRKYRCSYPHIIIDSVPLDFSIEDEMIIRAENQKRLLPFLAESVKRLQNTDLIVIPCNTAHIFFKDLRERSKVPVVSIVEEVTKKIKLCGYRKIGLLATSSTAKSGIYSYSEIEFLYPEKKDQTRLSEIIVKIVRNNPDKADKEELQRIAQTLRERCDAILLACTDLQAVLKGDYLDSFEILVNSVFEKFGGVENGKTVI